MNSISYNIPTVKQNSAKRTNLALTSGAKAKGGKFAPPPPPSPVLTIGKLVSLELTLAEYEITPNAATVAKIGGAQ